MGIFFAQALNFDNFKRKNMFQMSENENGLDYLSGKFVKMTELAFQWWYKIYDELSSFKNNISDIQDANKSVMRHVFYYYHFSEP